MTDLPLPVAFGRVAAQLSLLHETAASVQGVAADLTTRAGGIDAAGLAQLQSLNRMTQELQHLSALVADLAASASDDPSGDASAAVGAVALDSLRLKLCGGAPEPSDGEAELF